MVAGVKPNRKQGFAVMGPLRVKEIASMGGKASSLKGTSHKWTSEEARAAGRKGAAARAAKLAALQSPPESKL